MEGLSYWESTVECVILMVGRTGTIDGYMVTKLEPSLSLVLSYPAQTKQYRKANKTEMRMSLQMEPKIIA